MPTQTLAKRTEERIPDHPGVYRRTTPTGQVSYVYRWRDRRGNQHRKTAPTLAAAVKALKVAQAAAIIGDILPTRSVLTVQAWFDGWIVAHRVRESTRREYRASMKHHVLPTLGKMKLTAVEPRDVRELMASWDQKRLGYSAQRNALAALKAMLSQAVEDKVIRVSPAAGIRAQKPAAGLMVNDHEKALSDSERARIAASLTAEQRFMTDFLLQTGVRIGECLELRWHDFDGHHIHVRRQVYEGTVAPPKSRYGVRTIPLGPTLAKSLWARRMAAARPKDDDLIFPNRVGGHVLPSNVHRWLKPACEKAGVPWAGPHTYRHTCGSLLIERGVDPVQVSRWLGHHSAAFTMQTYAHQLRALPTIDLVGVIAAGQTGNVEEAPAPLRAVN